MSLPKYLLRVQHLDGHMQDIAIHILPNEPTVPQVQVLRIVTERQADPRRYLFCAVAFEMLDMPAAAAHMRDRAAHYSGGV